MSPVLAALLRHQALEVFSGQTALPQDPEQGSLRQIAVQRHNGSVVPFSEADVASPATHYLEPLALKQANQVAS